MSLPQPDSVNVRRYGSPAPLPEQTPLHAGPLSLVYEAGCLRNIRLGEHEILRRIYVAIRDRSWGTAPDEISDLQIDRGPDAFHIRFHVANRLNDVDFAWQGEIRGEADGTIHFSMDGEAQADFQRARIGFCVLPPMTVAGHPARIEHVDGTQDETPFPETIAPQLVIDGQIKPAAPFEEMRSLSYQVAPDALPDVWATLAFEGDIFEMEDQRNWTDASYKVYSTPLRLPFPVQVRRGDRVQQSITLSLAGELPQVDGEDEAVPQITLADAPAHTLPTLGLGMAGHGIPLSVREVGLLKELDLAHLRVDLHLSSQSYADRFRQACTEAAALGTALEVALFADEEDAAALEPLLESLRTEQPRIARWLVFDRDGVSSTPAMVERVRAALSAYDAGAPVGGGTNGYFTDLNRDRPDLTPMDVVAYSLNPQVHAFDNRSLMETPAAQAVTVQSAFGLAAGKPIAVSPVTLRPRYNPHAGDDGPDIEHGQLPPQVDARQMSLFGAAWTVASLKYLAESGAASVTYFETTGWCGVMETEAGSPLPQQFPSTPGGVFPLYHVFADVAEFAGGSVVPAQSTQPLHVEALALRHGDNTRLLVANLCAEPQEVLLRGLPGQVALRALDEAVFTEAVAHPDQFRAQPSQLVAPDGETQDGALRWTLPPYAVLRVDFH